MVREQIRTQLQNQKLAAQRDSVLRSLRSQTIVVVDLKASLGFRVQVSADGGPSKGGATAPATIVECSDFHCLFCKRMLPTLAQIESQYGDNVTLVLRDDPIDQLHPRRVKRIRQPAALTSRGSAGPLTTCASPTRRRPTRSS
jgi:protein-disulfide isomerase